MSSVGFWTFPVKLGPIDSYDLSAYFPYSLTERERERETERNGQMLIVSKHWINHLDDHPKWVRITGKIILILG